jgi:hypothetical protein
MFKDLILSGEKNISKTSLMQLNKLEVITGIQFVALKDSEKMNSFENEMNLLYMFKRWHNRLFLDCHRILKGDELDLFILINHKNEARFTHTKGKVNQITQSYNRYMEQYKNFDQIALYVLLQLALHDKNLSLSFKNGAAYINDLLIYNFVDCALNVFDEDDLTFTKLLIKIAKKVFSNDRTDYDLDFYYLLTHGMYDFVKLANDSDVAHGDEVIHIIDRYIHFVKEIPYELDDDLQTFKERLFSYVVEVEKSKDISYEGTLSYIAYLNQRKKYGKALMFAKEHILRLEKGKMYLDFLKANITLAICMFNCYELYQSEQLFHKTIDAIKTNTSLDNQHKEQLMAQSYFYLASLSKMNFDDQQTEKYIALAQNHFSNLNLVHDSEKTIDIVKTMLLKSKMLAEAKKEKEALELANNAYAYLLELDSFKSEDLLILMHETTLHLCELYAHQKDDQKVNDFLAISKKTLLPLFKKDYRLYHYEIIHFYLMNAKINLLNETYDLAYEFSNKAHQTIQLVKRDEPLAYLFELLESLMYKAESKFESHQDGIALLNYKRVERLIKQYLDLDILKLYPFIALYASRMGHLYGFDQKRHLSARHYFEQAIYYYHILMQLTPRYAADYYTALQDFARFEYHQDNLENALNHYEMIIQFIHEQKKMDLFWMFAAAEAYSEAGDVAFDLGNDYLALSYFEKALQLYEKLYKVNPSKYGSFYIQALQINASANYLINEHDQSIYLLDQAIRVCEQLFDTDESLAKEQIINITKEKANIYFSMKAYELSKRNYEFVIDLWKETNLDVSNTQFEIEEVIQQLILVYHHLNEQDNIHKMNELLIEVKLKQNII